MRFSIDCLWNAGVSAITSKMSGGGDNNAQKQLKDDETVIQTNDYKETTEKQKMIGGLKVIKLPPPPDDFCTVCDPVMKSNLRLAVFTTLFCWLPLGIVPVIFGIISIYFALKAQRTENPEIRKLYSEWSSTISWIGMILFVTILTITVVIIATAGIL